MSALPSRSFQSSGAEFISAQKSYFDVLVGVDVSILDKAITKFLSGELIPHGESEQWFPSPAAIAHQCRQIISELGSDRARERGIKNAVAELSAAKAKDNDLSKREILDRDVSHGEWVTKAKNYPVGSVWEARTGRVYAPSHFTPDAPQPKPLSQALQKWEDEKAKMNATDGDDIKTIGEIRAGLVSKIGQDAFDKLPDLGSGAFNTLKR